MDSLELKQVIDEVCPDHIHNWNFAKLMPKMSPVNPERSMFVCICGAIILTLHAPSFDVVKDNLRNAGEIVEGDK